MDSASCCLRDSKIARVITTAVNSEIETPQNRVTANPRIGPLPK